MPESPNKLIRFWEELKRRKVIHVIVVYATASFVIIELVNNVYEPLKLPDWTPLFFIIVLTVGFPLAIIVSWIFDISLKGIHKTESSDQEDLKKVNKAARHEKSIMVLPFDDISPNKDQEYFSDGFTEEIITQLAHLKVLRVISRSTSMALKNTTKNILTISRELSVDYILEGSIRKSENKIRITSQLIDGTSDEHLWADKFDGTMDAIFDVQEKIARKIVEAIHIELTPRENKILEDRPIKNLKAYDLLNLAKYESNKFNKEGFDRGIKLAKQAIEIEGDNAELYATLGFMYYGAYDFGLIREDQIFDLMEECATKALRLNSEHALAQSVKGLIFYKKGDLPRFLSYARPAADLGDDIQFLMTFVLAELGLLNQANKYAEEGLATNPLNWMSGWAKACVDLFQGKPQEGYHILFKVREKMAPEEAFLGWWIAQMAAYAGKNDTAHHEFKKVADSDVFPWNELSKLFQLALESNLKEVTDQIEMSSIKDMANTDELLPLFIANALALLNEKKNAMVWLKKAIDWGFSNYKFLTDFNIFLKPLVNDPQFKIIINQARKQQEAISF